MTEGTASLAAASDHTKQDVFISVVVHQHQFSVPRSPTRASKCRISSIENLNFPDVTSSDSHNTVSRRNNHPYLRTRQSRNLSRSKTESSTQNNEGSFSHLELASSPEPPTTPRRKQRFHKSLGQFELNQEDEERREKRQLQRRRRLQSLSRRSQCHSKPPGWSAARQVLSIQQEYSSANGAAD